MIAVDNDDASSRNFTPTGAVFGTPGFSTAAAKAIAAGAGNAMSYWATQFQVATVDEIYVLLNTWAL